MRSSSIYMHAAILALALVLFTASSAPVVNAAHGELKERQPANWWDKYFQEGENGQVEVKVVNPTTTRTYTLYPGRRQALATTTTTRRTSTSTRATSTRATSTKATSTKVSTTSKASSTSTSAPSTGTPALSSFAANILKAHNDARSPRGANALTWSTEAEAAAKAWGDKCIWQHGGATGMGQNLAASAGYKQTGQQVVDAWMSEEKDYNPSNPTYSHFTQVVWKSTTQVGCVQSTCNKLYNPDGSETFPGFSPSYFTVCNYKPPGNYAGQYAANVQKL